MSEKRTPPRDDAELATRIAEALRIDAQTPSERARFAARVRERIARQEAGTRWRVFGGLAAATAAAGVAAVMLLGIGANEPSAPVRSDWPGETTAERVLFEPEWTSEQASWIDAEVLPGDYAAAALWLEP